MAVCTGCGGEAVRAEISQTLTDGDDVQAELRYLIEVLASPGG